MDYISIGLSILKCMAYLNWGEYIYWHIFVLCECGSNFARFKFLGFWGGVRKAKKRPYIAIAEQRSIERERDGEEKKSIASTMLSHSLKATTHDVLTAVYCQAAILYI